jgi:hypothetical protein
VEGRFVRAAITGAKGGGRAKLVFDVCIVK